MSSESHILNNFQSSIEDLEGDLQKMTELTIIAEGIDQWSHSKRQFSLLFSYC